MVAENFFMRIHPVSAGGPFHEGGTREPARSNDPPGGLRMNFALFQRRTDRHPVGLLIVVGLHGVLAAALLSAKLVKGPSAPPPIDLRPLDPVRKVEQKPIDLPQPTQTLPRTLVIPTPRVEVDRTSETIAARTDDRPTPEVVASVGVGDDPTVHDPPLRATARAARIDAGDARCRPDYPAAAQRAGATGTTRIRFSVDAMGRISGSQIVQSSGATRENRLLDRAAADALAQCPVQVGTDEMGRPMGTTTDVTYVWSLN
jgi:protein TonB